jgi:hypothetical protein
MTHIRSLRTNLLAQQRFFAVYRLNVFRMSTKTVAVLSEQDLHDGQMSVVCLHG